MGIVVSFAQVALILRLNIAIGFPDIAYLVCLTVFSVALTTMTFVPTILMFVAICPEGSEGTTYAMLTTISNIGATLASDFGTLFLRIWDVSNSTIKEGNYSGIEYLVNINTYNNQFSIFCNSPHPQTILTSVISVLPIALVWLLPESKEQLIALKNSGEKSETGGAVVLSVLAVAILFTIVLNLYILLAPGQDGGTDDSSSNSSSTRF